jgi:Flp pilus assembly pilin Flp
LAVGGISLVRRFVREECGQDVLEYALLAATVAVGAVAGLQFLLSMMGGSYSLSQANVGNEWQTPNPGGS